MLTLSPTERSEWTGYLTSYCVRWLKPKRLSRVLIAVALPYFVFYTMNGVEVATEYAHSLPSDDTRLSGQIAETVWAGVTWPVVLRELMTAELPARLAPLADRDL